MIIAFDNTFLSLVLKPNTPPMTSLRQRGELLSARYEVASASGGTRGLKAATTNNLSEPK